jgi:hypothetical protein
MLRTFIIRRGRAPQLAMMLESDIGRCTLIVIDIADSNQQWEQQVLVSVLLGYRAGLWYTVGVVLCRRVVCP